VNCLDRRGACGPRRLQGARTQQPPAALLAGDGIEVHVAAAAETRLVLVTLYSVERETTLRWVWCFTMAAWTRAAPTTSTNV